MDIDGCSPRPAMPADVVADTDLLAGQHRQLPRCLVHSAESTPPGTKLSNPSLQNRSLEVLPQIVSWDVLRCCAAVVPECDDISNCSQILTNVSMKCGKRCGAGEMKSGNGKRGQGEAGRKGGECVCHSAGVFPVLAIRHVFG